MSLLYVPILAAKQGEFSALSNLPSVTGDRVTPVFEVPNPGPGKPLEISLAKTATKAGKAWSGREAFLDISKWKPNARTETGIHVLEFSFFQFRSQGITTHPVIGYDRWDDLDYIQALKNIRASYAIKPCLRLDREAIEDAHDPTYFAERIEQIMSELDLTAKNLYVLIDLGDVTKSSTPDTLAEADTVIDAIRSLGFTTIILAGCSIPATINTAVENPDTAGCIPRIEMMVWKAVFEDRKDSGIVFGDYSVRNSDAADGVIAPHANAKIRYTISNQFFIVRGHSKQLTRLAVQNKELARILVASPYYMGAAFSWGDGQILQCSIGAKEMGSPTTWIGIDTNHHIHAVVNELFEFQRQVVPVLVNA